ncbi:MAG: S1/P1 Nuclease [Phenylobacterium sp.]|uniref:S1/P1 Nuclease n=1 Tax=Phenylobacterium sp. TaxID=1871053 RepID=UPI00391BD58E
MTRTAALAAVLVVALSPAPALAWGSHGHRIVGEAAMAALPAEVPAFLRTPRAIADVGELSREQDRTKGAGRVHDHNRDPGHFVDLDEEGRVLGGPLFSPLPPTRAEYEKALQAAGLDSWKGGYLQYSIIDRHQHLAKEFGYWRAVGAALAREKDRTRRAWLQRDLARREAQILQTIGDLSHFVGDGAQPLHVSVHYNGWGDYPNPKGYTNARIHGPFEGEFVAQNVSAEAVRAGMAPFRPCDCAVEARTVDYLLASLTQVEPLYALEKAGGLRAGDPRGRAFVTERLAAGASELRDMVTEAWRVSLDATVGWPAVKVRDVLDGKLDPFDSLYGVD